MIGDGRIYFVSAKEGKGIDKLPLAAFRLFEKMNSSVSTGRLNSTVQKLCQANPPRYVGGKRFKVYYSVKISSRPYTVRLYCNSEQSLTREYRRYLVNGLRSALKLGGVAINLEVVGKPQQSVQQRLSKK